MNQKRYDENKAVMEIRIAQHKDKKSRQQKAFRILMAGVRREAARLRREGITIL
jgi:hypothetical protein